MRAMVEAGAIGRVTTFRAREGHSGPHAAHFWDAELAGGVRTLDALIDVMNLGVTRVGATATKAIIDDFRARKSGSAAVPAAVGPEGGS